MSNYSASISKYKTGKDGKVKYRVYYSYISAETNKRVRTCKRGFEHKNKAVEWVQNTLPSEIKRLEREKDSVETMTMEKLVKEYLLDAELDDEVQETTMRTKTSNLNKHIMPFFKDKIVYELKARDIKDWQRTMKQARQKNGKPYSKTYLRTVENQLSAIFNYAVKYYELPKNPIAQRMGSKDAPPATIWELSMYRKFQKQIEDKPEYYYAFEVFFWTGVRLGELLAITPADIDFNAKTLTICKAMRYYNNGTLAVAPTKTKSSVRKIYLPDFLLEELREYLDSISLYDDNARIFNLNKTNIHDIINKYSVIAEVPRITIHALRHSHASMLEHLGTSRVTLKQRLGHKLKENEDTTTTYVHPYDNDEYMVAKILNEVHNGNIDPSNLFDSLLRTYGKGVV